MFIEREAGGERALICSVSIRDPWYEPDPSEFESLVLSAGAEIVGVMIANLKIFFRTILVIRLYFCPNITLNNFK